MRRLFRQFSFPGGIPSHVAPETPGSIHEGGELGYSNKFLDPATDGAVLPVLHLNGWKIANPTVLARIPETELLRLLEGYGHRPIVVTGDQPAEVEQLRWTTPSTTSPPSRLGPATEAASRGLAGR